MLYDLGSIISLIKLKQGRRANLRG